VSGGSANFQAGATAASPAPVHASDRTVTVSLRRASGCGAPLIRRGIAYDRQHRAEAPHTSPSPRSPDHARLPADLERKQAFQGARIQARVACERTEAREQPDIEQDGAPSIAGGNAGVRSVRPRARRLEDRGIAFSDFADALHAFPATNSCRGPQPLHSPYGVRSLTLEDHPEYREIPSAP
jgi:hypothetical protein